MIKGWQKPSLYFLCQLLLFDIKQIRGNAMSKIPTHTVGTDLETASTNHNAFIFGIGSAAFQVSDLTMISSMEARIDRKDSTQEGREVDQNTMDWWHGSDPWCPTREARFHAMGGKLNLLQAAEQYREFYYSLPIGTNTEVVHAMRGPDFDMPILDNIMKFVGLKNPLKFSRLDSHRTSERGLLALGIERTTDAEIERFWNKPKHKHTAEFDAAVEGYELAKFYYLLSAINEFGYSEALVQMKLLSEGKDPKPLPMPEPPKEVNSSDFM